MGLLCDCKYGYDSQPNQLRLTLLRSPTWPDPLADRGKHQFTYAIYPYPGNWQQAEAVKRVRELNLPLKPVYSETPSEQPYLAPVGSFLDLGADNLILLAFKPGEQGDWILRCYECQGKPTEINFSSDLELAIALRVNLLEESINSDNLSSIQAWQIASFLLGPTPNPHDPQKDQPNQ
jgi:alpha-mannosidase